MPAVKPFGALTSTRPGWRGPAQQKNQEERALVSVDSCSSAPRLPHLLDISGGEAHNDQPAVPSNTFERWDEEADRVVDDVNAIAVRQF